MSFFDFEPLLFMVVILVLTFFVLHSAIVEKDNMMHAGGVVYSTLCVPLLVAYSAWIGHDYLNWPSWLGTLVGAVVVATFIYFIVKRKSRRTT